jgi:hypothetical protein
MSPAGIARQIFVKPDLGQAWPRIQTAAVDAAMVIGFTPHSNAKPVSGGCGSWPPVAIFV